MNHRALDEERFTDPQERRKFTKGATERARDLPFGMGYGWTRPGHSLRKKSEEYAVKRKGKIAY